MVKVGVDDYVNMEEEGAQDDGAIATPTIVEKMLWGFTL